MDFGPITDTKTAVPTQYSFSEFISINNNDNNNKLKSTENIKST